MEKKQPRNLLAYIYDNKNKSVKILGIDRKTLRNKLKKAWGNITQAGNFAP